MKNKTPLKPKIIFLGTSLLAMGGLFGCSETGRAKTNLVTMDAPSAGVVAKINGENITEEQLIGDSELQVVELEKQIYDLKMNRLNKLVAEKVFGAEAKKDGLANADEYVQKKILIGEIKISDAEFKKFVKEKNIPDASLTPEIKGRISAYLADQKREAKIETAVAKLTKNNPVEVYFKKPKSDIQIELGQAPVRGKESAPVTVVEFSDFECPFCGRAAKTVSEIEKKYGNKVKVVFKQFPLPMHKDAMPAAEASMCVNAQGSDKFWKFHDLAFSSQDQLDSAGLSKLAKSAGVDVKQFSACVAAHEYSDFVKKDQAYGEKLGVRSTPTFFINGQVISGAVPTEVFAEAIDEQLAAAKAD